MNTPTKPVIPAPLRHAAIEAALRVSPCDHGPGCVACLVDAVLAATLEPCAKLWSWTWYGDDETDDHCWETRSEDEARREAGKARDATVVYRYRTPWYLADPETA